MATGAEVTDTSNRIDMDESAELLFQRRCGCFWFSCFPSDRSTRRSSCIRGEWWERVKTAAEEPDNSDRWWVRGWNALRRVREWSEIVAGPKWKTFIRRFNRHGRGRLGKYQYDPLSYKLNFDEGGPNQEADYAYGDFSTRFAAPLNKSRDLSKDMPVFMAAH
ncbi:uncharacterized protein LOC116250193 [Nymphaea colorata]|uniref:Uncharacterized protein n=1 Tax=Nymphaea colorata TaxID=210225 RepID=A0A5K1BWA1_9MAGN|nr:uncharacterized protein LOC116250193 [Nymphaea colorata]